MKLLVDLGNSRMKWATLNNAAPTPRGAIPLASPPDTSPAQPPVEWSGLPPMDAIVLCSVASAANTRLVVEWCRHYWPCPLVTVRPRAADYGIRCAYPRPETLGADRWAAMVGAHHRQPGNKCVVDIGTAATIDLLDAAGHHLGGLIAPGYHAMLSALNHSTGLPIPPGPPPPQPAPGDNTADCIRAGALHSLAGLVRVSQAGLQKQLSSTPDGPAPRIILTGGDGAALLPLLPQQTLYEPDLLFHGLAVIAETPR